MKNNYGVTHGLAVAGLMIISFSVVRGFVVEGVISLVLSAAIGMFAPYGVIHWFRREARVRGSNKFWTWYLDSMFDFLTPLITHITLTVWLFNYYVA